MYNWHLKYNCHFTFLLIDSYVCTYMDDAPLYICVLILYSLPPGTNKIPANPSVVIDDDEIVDRKGSYISYHACTYVCTIFQGM